MEQHDGGVGFTPQPAIFAWLQDHKIPEEMHDAFTPFTPEEFGMVATSLESLDTWMDNLLWPVEANEAVLKARVRLLWQACSRLTQCPAKESPCVSIMPSEPTAAVADAGWVETFPKKLGAALVKSMVQKFKARYPSESLAPDVMPSARLLALVAKQLQDRSIKYVPWKWRMSEEQQDHMAMLRPSKVPKLETLLFDDIPEREIPTSNVGKCYMQEILGLLATAIALCEGAHLHTLKDMNRRFVQRCFDRLPQESGLRCPSVAEAQVADQRLWQQIAHLYNEESCSLDDAIHEVIVVRADLQAMLMPRIVARVLDLSMRESGSLESGWWVEIMWGSWVGCGNFGKKQNSPLDFLFGFLGKYFHLP